MDWILVSQRSLHDQVFVFPIAVVSISPASTVLMPIPSQERCTMSQFFRLQVDTVELTDAMFAFVTDPSPSRNERPIVLELNDTYPEAVDVLESMLLDGTEDRQDVAAYVDAVFGARGA